MIPKKMERPGFLQETKWIGSDYYQRKNKRTFVEWEKFVNNELNIDTAIVPREVLDAWIRCRHLGVDPFTQPGNEVLAGRELQKLLDRNKSFIDVSRPVMKNLYRFLEGSGFVVSLFDREGFILEMIGDHEFDQLVRMAKGGIGSLWSEKCAGNNATGTVVTFQKPVQLFGSQQYVKACHGGTGSGAPIFGPDGHFLGGIALSGRYFRANAHTLGMTVAAANAIENELRIRKAFVECQVAYSYQKTVISSILEALIAVDMKGCITLINDKAKKMFSLDAGNVEGHSLRDVFCKENHQLFSWIDSKDTVTDAEVRIFSKNSGSDFTLTCNPILSQAGSVIGKIIILNEIKRAKSMVTKMMGAKANFRFEDICGGNPRFLMTMDQAKMVSQSNSNVLLLGKSGTGKDLFAQAIHNASTRRNGPYLAINCGAIPRDLITSELFGHEEGAFTGSRRGGGQGKFELADGGTIFLDEIAEMPLELQTALLRVIEDKSILRIGGARVRPVDVRIIAATNKDLREEVRKGNFREDLYYRANVFAIEMIPLSERLDDIQLLMDCFIKRYAAAMNKRIDRVDKKVLDVFMNYPWPGNVRELQNVIERMMNYVRGHELTVDLIPSEIVNFSHYPEYSAGLESPDEAERKILVKMISMKFRKNRMAEQMQISRATLYRKMKKFELL